MSLLDKFDFSNGKLPPWLAPLIGLTRPLVTTLTAAILPIGGFMVGIIALVWPNAAMQAVHASTAFFEGIPLALYQLIGTIVIAYTGAITAESFRKPPQQSPENNAIDEAQDGPAAPVPPVDSAPTSRKTKR